MDYLAWVYLLDRAYLILADDDIRMEAAALGKPVLLIQGIDGADVDAAASRNVVRAGAGRLEIVARISSLLNESREYEAMRQASSQRAGSDSYRPMLEALANLRCAPLAHAHPSPGTCCRTRIHLWTPACKACGRRYEPPQGLRSGWFASTWRNAARHPCRKPCEAAVIPFI